MPNLIRHEFNSPNPQVSGHSVADVLSVGTGRNESRTHRRSAGMAFVVTVFALATLSELIANETGGRTIRLRCEAPDQRDGTRTIDVLASGNSAGALIEPNAAKNNGSWRFNGRTSIAYSQPSRSDGFAENFTWEGFFLSPASNKYLAETGIADRLITQFAFDKGNWTRLAIGLVADRSGLPRLSVELEGFEGRSFGIGDRVAQADRWHHFALVHEGSANAATIRWYLDYRLIGELFLGGQSNQNTLRPPGSAPFTIGARLRTGQVVNRGFDGFIDEVRLSPRVLQPASFLRCENPVFSEQAQETPVNSDTNAFWRKRHQWARSQAANWAPKPSEHVAIDSALKTSKPLIDDATFLRRLSLTVRGRIPRLEAVTSFLADQHADKRSRAIDRMLAEPEWADGWVGYWQDVLAENPSVVFPTLNNSGAFRRWIYESFRDNVAFDRFATELLLLENAKGQPNGPAGFALATGNDSPMAMRAHVAVKAFAAVDLKCARCHDSPVDEFEQADLFRIAAYLNDGPLTVPAASLAAIGKANEPGVLTTSLKAGQRVEPAASALKWLDVKNVGSLSPIRSSSRAQLAAMLTSPRNSRFSDVIVNRLWKRYFGTGLVEPVDHWSDRPEPIHPDLLRTLSAGFVKSGYDLKWLARHILASQAWQSVRDGRSLSAEQLVDSMFVAAGKELEGEVLGVYATDPGAVQLPQPTRAWQFAALPNERDRPSLGMPVNQTIVDVMKTFGWSGSRQQPSSHRDQSASALQALMLFNGLMSQRIVRLSERSAITELCLKNQPLSALVDQLFLTVLSRYPDAEERANFVAVLSPGYQHRRTGQPPWPIEPLSTFQPDWRKYLEPEQTKLMLEAQKKVARGERPTARLTADFRERVEDVVWALINSPEFVVVP